MAKITVLGAGMVGRAIGTDLAERHQVRSVDRDPAALTMLSNPVQRADLSVPDAVREVCADADLVVCAVPGFLGHRTLTTLLPLGKPIVDISFMPEDALDLDALAREHGVTCVVDMGVAPGMDNVIFGHHDARMKVERFECLVGGLPRCRTYPFEYKAPFSPIDVIEEYTRPARFVEHGEVVTRPALSEPELVQFAEIGTLESFNSDGLRSLIRTMPHVPDMKEKTLRYPGHRDLMAALAAGGFFDTTPIDIAGHAIRPIDAASAILLAAWKLAPDEPELTVMRVTVEGIEDGHPVSYVYALHDVYDPTTQTSSMARTTGYACASAVELVLDGSYVHAGITAPEVLGRSEGALDRMLTFQAERNIHYRCTRTVQ